MSKNYKDIIKTSLRTIIITMAVCCIGYTGIIYGIGQLFTPYTANGSIIEINGEKIGSERLAQSFKEDKYFHSRPSAVDYNTMGAGGSNASPYSQKVRERAEEIIKYESKFSDKKVPADMLSASGSGLDPHISIKSAFFQAERISKVRNINIEKINTLINSMAEKSGGVFNNYTPIVNVLKLNIALDNMDR